MSQRRVRCRGLERTGVAWLEQRQARSAQPAALPVPRHWQAYWAVVAFLRGIVRRLMWIRPTREVVKCLRS